MTDEGKQRKPPQPAVVVAVAVVLSIAISAATALGIAGKLDAENATRIVIAVLGTLVIVLGRGSGGALMKGGLIVGASEAGAQLLRIAGLSALLVGVSGCGLFSAGQASQYVPMVTQAMDAFLQVAKDKGADVDELPVTCEHEWHPPLKQGEPGKLLVLCEAEVK